MRKGRVRMMEKNRLRSADERMVLRKLMATSLLLSLLSIPFSYAGPPQKSAPSNGVDNGGGSARHLYLYQKYCADSSLDHFLDGSAEIVSGGAWGKLNINENTMSFVFNGQGLQPDAEYALILYLGEYTGDWQDAWVVARGWSNAKGRIHISGEWQPWIARLWLVLGSDVAGDPDGCHGAPYDAFVAWNPGEYLFEYAPL
jgi:hypothetical protein